MATPFSVELSTRESPQEAQARAAAGLTDAARAVGLRLTKRGAGELTYTPRVQFPFLLMLWHNLNRERMTVRFESGPEGGTRVIISGSVARGHHAVASEPDHWLEAFGGSAQSA